MAKAVGDDKGIEPGAPDANGADAQTPAPPPPPAAAQPEEQPFFRPTAHQAAKNLRRFGLAYLVHAIAVGVAVGLGIVLIGRGSSSSSSARGR